MIYKEVLIQAGIKSMPHIGESLADLYFHQKSQGRFDKIERFYAELQIELAEFTSGHFNLGHALRQQDMLLCIIEKIHDVVEIEASPEKLGYLVHFYRSLFAHPLTDDGDQRLALLNALEHMSLLECRVLANILRERGTPATDNYTVLNAIHSLQARGFVAEDPKRSKRSHETSTASGDLWVTPLGKRFAELALNVTPIPQFAQWQQPLVEAA